MPAEGQRDPQREGAVIGLIELLELGPQARDLDAHGGIELGIEVGAPAEGFGRDRIFADRLALVLPKIEKERPHGGSGPESFAVRNLSDQVIVRTSSALRLAFGLHFSGSPWSLLAILQQSVLGRKP